MNYGSAIKNMLSMQKKSSASFAKEIGMSKQGFSHLINRGTCSVQQFAHVCNAMDCDVVLSITDRTTNATIETSGLNYGLAIKTMLNAQSTTMTYLAKSIGLSRQSLSNFVNSTTCSIAQLERVCNGMNCDLSILITDRKTKSWILISSNRTTINDTTLNA